MPNWPNDNKASELIVVPAASRFWIRIFYKFLGALLLVIIALGFAVIALAALDRRLPIPGPIIQSFEKALNDTMAQGPGSRMQIGQMDLAIAKNLSPILHLREVKLFDPAGKALMKLPELRMLVDLKSALQGQFQLRSLAFVGAQIILERDSQGVFNMVWTQTPQSVSSIAQGALEVGHAQNIGSLMQAISQNFASPLLENIKSLSGEALSLTFDDKMTGQVWELGDGRLSMQNDAELVGLELGVSVQTKGGTDGQVTIHAVWPKNGDKGTLSITFEAIQAVDLAAQAFPFGWMGTVSAPISGRIAGIFSVSGNLREVEGNLDMGAGFLTQQGTQDTIGFEEARINFDYDDALNLLKLNEFNVKSKGFQGQGVGQILLPDPTSADLSYSLQLQWDRIGLHPHDVFLAPIAFDGAQMDLRLRLKPFQLEIGQISLQEGGSTYLAQGFVRAAPKGWQAGLRFDVDKLAHKRLMALWPTWGIPNTRLWLKKNIKNAQYHQVTSYVKLAPDQKPEVTLGFEFDQGRVRFMPALPEMTEAAGYGALEAGRYVVVLTEGQVRAPDGGTVNAAGTVLTIDDVAKVPADLEIALQATSPLAAALSLVDLPPFNFMSKASLKPNFASGAAQVTGLVLIPLVKKLTKGDVKLALNAQVQDFSTDSLVPEHRLNGSLNDIKITNQYLDIEGELELNGVPLIGTFHQDFLPVQNLPIARVQGHILLSDDSLRKLDIALPEDFLTGEAMVPFEIDLPKEKPPQARVRADMAPFGLQLPMLGWGKPQGQAGRLEVDAVLSRPLFVPRLLFRSDASLAQGQITLREGGALDQIDFERLTLEDWFDGGIRIVGQGTGLDVKLEVTGGILDLRKFKGVPASATPLDTGLGLGLSVALDKLHVTQGIALTDFSGNFNLGSGFGGRFSGLVNAVAPIRGIVATLDGGDMEINLHAKDSGLVLKAANVFTTARGGDFKLNLRRPVGDAPLLGQLSITNIEVRNAPILAELLSTISVVGLVNQLRGAGLVFAEVGSDIVFGPNQIELRNGFADGAALGGTLSGSYGVADQSLDMKGVISPLYLFNQVGSVLTGRGEGFFSFNYKLRGTSDAPEVAVNPLSILTPGVFRNFFKDQRTE